MKIRGKQITLDQYGSSTTPPLKTTPFQEEQCLGWASITAAGVLVNANAQYGVLSIAHPSTGTYTVTFSTPVASIGEVCENVSCAGGGANPSTANSSITLDGSNRPIVTITITTPAILLGLINFNNQNAAFRISIFGRPQ